MIGAQQTCFLGGRPSRLHGIGGSVRARSWSRATSGATEDTAVGKAGQKETNMSLDNASHPGRTGTDELVPSRYALRVGEIDVLVVSDGVLSLPGAMLAYNADPANR